MTLPARLDRIEKAAAAQLAVNATIIAEDDADAMVQLEALMLQSGGPVAVSLEINGRPRERFMINDKPHEYWVEMMERGL